MAGIPVPAPPPTSTTSSPSSSTTTPPTTPPTTGPPPPTSSTTTTTSTTSTTSTSTTSTTTSSTTTTATTSTTAAIPPTTAPVVVTTAKTSSSSTPSVVTQFSTQFVSATPSATSSQGAASHGKSFFQNTGAVAGVFTVVGLIGIVILGFLVTNAIRRRRARDFDKELIAATREAAATAPNPNFLDDEEDPEDRFKRSGYGMNPGYNGNGGGTGYSDVSHGTYGQPPMEAYNMRDLGGHGPAVGEIYDPYTAGGAAGIGVARARSMRVDPAQANPNYAAALQEGGAPYPKFAIGPHETYNMRSPNNLEVLEAAGMGNHVAGAGMISHGQQQQQQQYQQQYQQGPPTQQYPSLGRNKSNSTTLTHSTQYYPSSYSSNTPLQPYSTTSTSTSTPPTQQAPSAYPASLPNPHAQSYSQATEPSGGGDDGEDAYGGYIVESPTAHNNESVGHEHSLGAAMQNPFGGESSPEGEDHRREEEEEEEREEPRRVLKVANE